MGNSKVLQKATKELTKAKAPSKPKDIIYDPMGQWKYPGQNTRIPGGDITMQGVPYPVYAQPNVGQPQMMYPGQEYMFPEADYVDEYPQMKRGGYMKGLVPMPKPSKKGLASKAYSRSLDATNKLFTESYLFKKPKDKRRKVFDPNAKYYASGGEYGMPLGTGVSQNFIGNRDNFNVGGIPNLPLRDNRVNYNAFVNGFEPMSKKQDGGEQDAMNAMMKARLAYANEFGNPAAQRMINLPDNPYQFDDGNTGTHYMASMDNYAVPQIQDENGQLMLGDYGPESNEAMRFDSDEDAAYFAEHYKDVSPGFIEAELTDDEIQAYKDGGYVVEDISVPELQKGGELYTVKGNNSVYRKVNGKWEVDTNKSGKFQPLSKGDIKERTAVLNKQAKPLFDPEYQDKVNTQSEQYKDTKSAQPKKQLTPEDKKSQENFNKNFKVNKDDKYTEIQNKIKQDQQGYVELAKQKGFDVTQDDLNQMEERGWNVHGNVGVSAPRSSISNEDLNPENHISTQFPKNATAGDYGQRGWEYLTNPGTALEYALGTGKGSMPYNINRLKEQGVQVNSDRNLVGNMLNVINPLDDVETIRSGVSNLTEGDKSGYATAGLGLFGFIPGLGDARKLGKAGKTVSKLGDKLKNVAGPSNKVGANLLDQAYVSPSMGVLNKTLNKISPLNYVPGYGKKLEGAVKPLGNIINKNIKNGNLVEQQGLIGKAKSLVGKGVDQPITTKLNRTNTDIYSAKFDDAVENSDIVFGDPMKQGVIGRTFNKRNAITPLQSKTTGNPLSQISLLDEGVSLNRRLPFSNRYVDVNKQKLLNNEFQWSTTGAGLQNVAEKFGKAIPIVGGAGAATAALTYNPYDYIDESGQQFMRENNKTIEDVRKAGNYVPTRMQATKEGFLNSITAPKDFLSRPDPYYSKTILDATGYEKGGDVNNFIELDLTPEEIEEYEKGGWVVEYLD